MPTRPRPDIPRVHNDTDVGAKENRARDVVAAGRCRRCWQRRGDSPSRSRCWTCVLKSRHAYQRRGTSKSGRPPMVRERVAS